MSLQARFGRLARHSQQARGFAEAAAKDTYVSLAKGLDVPIHGSHGRYALALFNAGAKTKVLEGVTEDLAGVLSMAGSSAEFAQFLDDPSVPKKTKQEVMDSALTELSARDVTKSFFSVLAENNRLTLLPKIAETFDELVAASRGEVKAKVTMAEEPEEEELAEITSGLKSLLKPEQKLNLQLEVQPVLIGGLIIEMGDKRVDLSILSRVKKIQQLLRETT